MKRSVTSAIVVGALLVGVACSGGGVSPQTGPKIQMATPKSVSPALVKTTPMVKTPIQPASAMAGRHPATAIVPQSWTQIPGSATQVAAAADGSIFVLSDQPAGADKYIWHYASGTWTNIPGLASQISVAPNGTLNVINSSGAIYAYSAGNWSSPGGGAKSIATLSDNSIVVVSNAGAGDQGLWRNNGTSWQQLAGGGVGVYGSQDPSSHTVGGNPVNPGGVFILNNAGEIYYENTDNSFAQLPEHASSLASRPGGLFALAAGPAGAGGNAIYYFDFDAPPWSLQTGAAVSLSVGLDNELFAVSSAGGIYETDTGTPAPTSSPTPTPTTSPTPVVTPTSSPTPGSPLAVNPNPISLLQTGASSVTVTESGFSGSITAVSSDTGVLTVAASPVTMTAGTATVNISAVASGSTTLTVSDGSQTVLVPVHVTITGVVVSTSNH